jgi:glycosyltransferase involved in cell wall biosynthesis
VKILLVMPFPLSDLGGVTTFVTQLQEGLNERGHRALLLVPGDSDRVARVTGCERSDTYGAFLRSFYVPGALFKGVVAFLAYLPLTLFDLWTFLRRERIQVVHVHFPTPSLLYFGALRLVSPWKLMVTLHGSDIYALPRRTRLYRRLLGVLFSISDCVVAGTAHLIQSLHAAYPRFQGATRVVPNGNALVGCDPAAARAEAPLPERYVLAVGNLVPRKGYDVLLTALALARRRGCNLHLVIVGEGPEASSLAALAAELRVQDRVLFAGRVPHGEIPRLYLAARFFVHAAREEAQGLVLVEAMFSKKAVIATRVLGIPELVRDGETGLLVEPGDAESLADAMIRLDADDGLRSTLSDRAFAYVGSEHTWERFLARYVQAYEGVVGSMTDLIDSDVAARTESNVAS